MGNTFDSTDRVDIDDPAMDAWLEAAPMPTARNHHAAEKVDGRLMVTAG